MLTAAPSPVLCRAVPRRLPTHMQELLHKAGKASKVFEAQHGREPTAEELAPQLGVEASRIKDAWDAVLTPRSLDQPYGDAEGGTLGDIVEVRRRVAGWMVGCWRVDSGLMCHLARQSCCLCFGCVACTHAKAVGARCGGLGSPDVTQTLLIYPLQIPPHTTLLTPPLPHAARPAPPPPPTG
jgi:hypothetical protein